MKRKSFLQEFKVFGKKKENRIFSMRHEKILNKINGFSDQKTDQSKSFD